MKSLLLLLLSLPILVSCLASPYSAKVSGEGFSDKKMRDDIYRVTFEANHHTTQETTQTYWLYRCAQLSSQKGYQGFKILSDVSLVEKSHEPRLYASVMYPHMYYYQNPPKKIIHGDIKLLKGNVTSDPEKRVFNAKDLLKKLHKYVRGKKCESQNVCPHIKDYLGHK